MAVMSKIHHHFSLSSTKTDVFKNFLHLFSNFGNFTECFHWGGGGGGTKSSFSYYHFQQGLEGVLRDPGFGRNLARDSGIQKKIQP